MLLVLCDSFIRRVRLLDLSFLMSCDFGHVTTAFILGAFSHHLSYNWFNRVKLMGFKQCLIPSIKLSTPQLLIEFCNMSFQAHDLLVLWDDGISNGCCRFFQYLIDTSDLLVKLFGPAEPMPDVYTLLFKPGHLLVLLIKLVLDALDSVPWPLDELILECLGESSCLNMDTLRLCTNLYLKAKGEDH